MYVGAATARQGGRRNVRRNEARRDLCRDRRTCCVYSGRETGATGGQRRRRHRADTNQVGRQTHHSPVLFPVNMHVCTVTTLNLYRNISDEVLRVCLYKNVQENSVNRQHTLFLATFYKLPIRNFGILRISCTSEKFGYTTNHYAYLFLHIAAFTFLLHSINYL